MKSFLPLLVGTACFSVFLTQHAAAAPVTLVSWNHEWSYLHPMGSLPAGSGATEPNAGTVKWYASDLEFTYGYSGPAFGASPALTGVPATTGSYDSGKAAGPFGYDAALEYFTASNVPLPRAFTTIGKTLTQPLSGNRRTAYFRTTFTVPEGGVDSLTLNYLLDDGAFVYLDGELVARINVGTLGSTAAVADTYTTTAANETATENQLRTLALSLAPGATGGIGNATSSPAAANATILKTITGLKAGTHTLAISLHNQSATSSDLLMGIQLSGETIDVGSLDPVINHKNYFPSVLSIALQPDGKILVGGYSRIVRLNADGTKDASFAATISFGSVKAIAVQDDGKILIGGQFDAVNGEARNNIARLNTDGTTDFSFDPGSGADGPVHSVAIQIDGRILVGGFNGTFNGQPRNGIARLSPTGVLETTDEFEAPSGLLLRLPNILPVADGSMIIQPSYVQADPGILIFEMARLQPDGSIDPEFNVGRGGEDSTCAIRQPDGRMLVGGGTALYWHSIARPGLLRLTPSGALESTATFAAYTGTSLSGQINSICLQADGKIIATGPFDAFGGKSQAGVIRLLSNGTFDDPVQTAFSLGSWLGIEVAALQGDGQILIGGYFSEVRGQERPYFARLRNTPGSESVSITSSAITWMRSGSLPEVEWVKFDVSTNAGTTWTPVGIGTRIAGGWELSGVNLPPAGILRCRGRVHVSGFNGMGTGLVESRKAFGAGTALAAWREQRFGTSASSSIATDTADPDKDGQPNFVEFARGLDPLQKDSRQEIVSQTPAALRFEYLRNPAAAADGINFIVEWSDTMTAGSWSTTGVTTLASPEGDLERVTASIPRGTALHRYARLRMVK